MSETTGEAPKPVEPPKVEVKPEPQPEPKVEPKVEAPKAEPPKAEPPPKPPVAVVAPAPMPDPEPVLDSTMVRFEFGSVETLMNHIKAWVSWKIRNPPPKN